MSTNNKEREAARHIEDAHRIHSRTQPDWALIGLKRALASLSEGAEEPRPTEKDVLTEMGPDWVPVSMLDPDEYEVPYLYVLVWRHGSRPEVKRFDEGWHQETNHWAFISDPWDTTPSARTREQAIALDAQVEPWRVIGDPRNDKACSVTGPGLRRRYESRTVANEVCAALNAVAVSNRMPVPPQVDGGEPVAWKVIEHNNGCGFAVVGPGPQLHYSDYFVACAVSEALNSVRQAPSQAKTDQGRVDVEIKTCTACGGDGKETCDNPDHGFIGAMGGVRSSDIGRLGCPVCGHDPLCKVPNGGDCEHCGGTGIEPTSAPPTQERFTRMEVEAILKQCEEYTLKLTDGLMKRDPVIARFKAIARKNGLNTDTNG